MQASTAKIIDLNTVRAERARQKRRTELAAARRSGALFRAAPTMFVPYGAPFAYYGHVRVPVFGVTTPARMTAGGRYW